MATQSVSHGPAMVAAGSRVIIVVSSGLPPSQQRGFVYAPDVVGMRQGDALGALQEAGLSAEVFNDYSELAKRGTVTGQLPLAGGSAPTGSVAVLLVSSGPAPSSANLVPLIDVVGRSEADAVSALQAGGLSPQVVREHSVTSPAGTVMTQLPSRDSLSVLETSNKPNWVLWAAVAAAVLLLAVVAFLFLRPTDTVDVPDVVGMTQASAMQALQAADLNPQARVLEDVEGEPGIVAQQDPVPGTRVPKGSAVEIGVIEGIELVEVPSVRRENQADATKQLQDAGLRVSVTRQSSTSVPQGLVMGQSPEAGQRVPVGTTVGIVISAGPEVENVRVPDVEGLTRADAIGALAEAGLKSVVVENSSAQVAEDVVISQLPAAGESVAAGTSVGVVVSTGPPTSEQVQVPDVVGLSFAEAQQIISDASLVPAPIPTEDSGRPANEVVAQAPNGGEQVAAGSSVVLFYSAGD